VTTLALLAFAASVAALAYTYAGYPLLLAAWGRLAPRPVRRASFEPDVVIVIVVYNGASLVGRKIASCLAQDYPARHLRILVVSDGSDDATCAIVEAVGDARVNLLAFPQRRGKAACVNDALASCQESFAVMTDVRQPLHPMVVRRLLENLADENVGAVSGMLTHASEGMSNFGEGLDAYWRYEQFIRRGESRVHSMVGVLGALYALRRECFREIPPDTILDDVLIPMRVVLQGRRVVFEGGALAYDEALTDAKRERTRKARTLAGNFQLLSTYPSLLLPWRNPIALQVISHKLMRLCGPLALAVALVSNLALVGLSPFFAATLAVQVAGYALALLGSFWPRAAAFRLVRLSMAFVSLNWYVVLGFIEFASNRETHLWKNPPPQGDGTRTSI
jgi:poly-beta-1,6-N-acetyl-D-glucosamine synthase